MINYDSNTIVLGVIGLIGLLSTLTIVVTAFKRNRLYNDRFQ